MPLIQCARECVCVSACLLLTISLRLQRAAICLLKLIEIANLFADAADAAAAASAAVVLQF